MSNDLLFLPVRISDTQTAQSIMLGAEIGQSDNLMSQELEKTVDNSLSADLIIAALLSNTEAIALLSGDIDGTIESVSGLPTLPHADYPQGSVVFLLTDNKLYRSTGIAWTKAVDGLDISLNSISANQIVVGGLVGSVITAGTMNADRLVSGSITALELSATAINGFTISGAFINGALITGGTLQTTASGTARVVIDAVNGVRIMTAGSVVRTQIDISGGKEGYISTDILYGMSNNIVIKVGTTAGLPDITMNSSTIRFHVNSTEPMSIGSASVSITGTLSVSGVITGDGSGLNDLDGSEINGTVADGVIASTIARKSMGSENINFGTGYGVASGGASVSLDDAIDKVRLWTNGAVIAEFGADTKISVGGVMKTVNFDNLDLGTGFKDYVYLT